MDREPDDLALRCELARMYRTTHRSRLAIQQWDIILEQDPSVENHEALIEIHARLQQHARVAAVYEAMVKHHPGERERALPEIMRAHQRAGDAEKAGRAAEAWLEIGPRTIERLTQAAALHALINRHDRALDLYEEARDLERSRDDK